MSSGIRGVDVSFFVHMQPTDCLIIDYSTHFLLASFDFEMSPISCVNTRFLPQRAESVTLLLMSH